MLEQKPHSTTSLPKHNWEQYDISSIVSGKDTNGTALLKLFLSDYSKLFNITVLNPSCHRCITEYLQKYKQKIFKMENTNTCQYKLKLKYNNIPLEFGSNVFVNNNNITDEYAEKLLERYVDPSKIFEVYPENANEPETAHEKTIDEPDDLDVVEITQETQTTPKVKKTRKSRK